ncbi:hypothetical protein OE88DRAFT_1548029 [Heliocybe sulcata]|uniref:Ig-like domain-containing protein n=1 Tax=Heliocybe sulcata TaxID=5364 RepID=A0A5C3NC51_9AGAM|nr:hypothetical protein OE88DRAFT_1548029 [Heliocybe sulcata]
MTLIRCQNRPTAKSAAAHLLLVSAIRWLPLQLAGRSSLCFKRPSLFHRAEYPFATEGNHVFLSLGCEVDDCILASRRSRQQECSFHSPSLHWFQQPATVTQTG